MNAYCVVKLHSIYQNDAIKQAGIRQTKKQDS